MKLLLNNYDESPDLQFFIVKICNFINMRFYFGFPLIFIIDRLAVKVFFDISIDFIPNIMNIFLISHHLPSKNTFM